jgi:hypothetical protein
MKVYVSSTYQDLVEHRAAVDRTLRRMGHDVIGMEQYVAEGSKPLDRCCDDVRNADVYVVIVAWRYGYVPEAGSPSPGKSITEIEHDAAVGAGKTVLAFLLDPEAPWPMNRVDAIGAKADAGAPIARFRAHLGATYLAGIFRTPDDLASQVAAAIAAQGLSRHMVDRVLAQTSVASGDMGQFGQGASVSDTTLLSIKSMIKAAGSVRALVVTLGEGDQWWSTRLFLLASLLRALTAVRQVAFLDHAGRFAGMASPAALVDGLAAAFPLLDEFGRRLRTQEPRATADTERETDRQVNTWNALVTEKLAGNERDAKVGVRAQLLAQWLGERLVSRCIQVDTEDLTMAQVQQIVDSLLPDVPVERRGRKAPSPPYELQLVDRDAFALELAREWVRAGIPRTPVL